MNTNDLYLEYARVIRMCEGTELADTPCLCVRWKWKGSDKWFYFDALMRHPNLNNFNINQDADFAVAVLEGKPVFIGDTIYYKCDREEATVMIVNNGGIIIVRDSNGEGDRFHSDKFTWISPAPKRTFNLNGVELPCPNKNGNGHGFGIDNTFFAFDTLDDAVIVSESFLKILTEARDRGIQL